MSNLPVEQLVAYEQGELSADDTLALFAELIESGLAWQLQGFYGRTAADFIRFGLITDAGQITDKGQELLS